MHKGVRVPFPLLQIFFDVDKPWIQQLKCASWKSKIWLPAIKGGELTPGMKYGS